MAVRVINIVLDEEELAYALSKKNKRTWKVIFMSGIEFKAWRPPKKTTK